MAFRQDCWIGRRVRWLHSILRRRSADAIWQRKLSARAFEDGEEFRHDGFVVFVIDPGQLNEATVDRCHPIDVSAAADDWADYLNPVALGSKASLPIAVTAPHIAQRIRAQSGTFTLHGSNIWALDYYDALRPSITKIFIPHTATDAIKASLEKVGVTESFIYPGLDSIARDIRRAEQLRHTATMEAHFSSVTESAVSAEKEKSAKKRSKPKK